MSRLRIDIADLLAHPGARRPVALRQQLDGLEGTSARVPSTEPIDLDLVLERIPDGVVVRGRVTTVWAAECSVCLAELERPLELSVSELFETEPVEGETYPIEAHEIDLEQLLRDSVMLELPLAPTCMDAGRREHANPPPQVDAPDAPDPRWAALSELEL